MPEQEIYRHAVLLLLASGLSGYLGYILGYSSYRLEIYRFNSDVNSESEANPRLNPKKEVLDSELDAKREDMCNSEKWESDFHQYYQEIMSNSDYYKDMPLCQKWLDYFKAYDDQFSRYRGKEVVFVEVGVQSGGSALMWRWYFGDKLHYVGLDINPKVQQFKAPWITTFVGDSGSKKFWDVVKRNVTQRPDIFLDDGGHTMQQQLMGFEMAYEWVKPDGIYVCEDLHTSYMADYGGFLHQLNAEYNKLNNNNVVNPDRFTELVKNTVDYIHAQRFDICDDSNLYCKIVKNSLQSFHVYESIVFMQKGPKVVKQKRFGGGWFPEKDVDMDYHLKQLTEHNPCL